MNTTIQLTLTEAETNALLTLIDLGVKNAGLNVATNAAFFLQRIQAAQKESSTPVTDKLVAPFSEAR